MNGSKSLNPLIATSWVAVVAAATCNVGHAQAVAPDDDREEKAEAPAPARPGGIDALQEVVILGAGTVRSTQTLNSELIAEQPPMTDAMALIDRLPGVNMGNADPFGNDEWSTDIDIRGFDRERLGFVIDGLPLGSSAYRSGARPNRFADNENLESVTVLQGASATGASSSQALGGSIQYVTRGPQNELGGKASFSGGDDNLRRYFVRFDSGPILGDRTFAYASYSDSTNDHWMDYGARAKNTREHAEIAVLQKLADNHSLQFKYVYNNRFGNNYNRVTTEQWEARPWNDGIHGPWTGNPRLDGNNSEGWIDPTEDHIFSLQGTFALPRGFGMTFTGYHHTTDGPGTWPWECVFEPESYTADSPGPTVCNRDENGVATVATMYVSQYMYDRDGITLNFSKELGSHALAFGSWYEVKDREHLRTYNQLLDVKAGAAWGDAYFLEFDSHYKTRTTSAYVQDTISLVDDRLHVNAGLSAMKVDIEYFDTRDTKGTNTYDSGFTFAPRAGAAYKVSDGTEVFGSYTRNYRALTDSQLRNRDVSNVDTETADSFDLGVRYKNSWINSSLTVYKIQFDNRIVDFAFTVDPEDQGSRAYEPDGIQINAGSQESTGVELAAQFRLPANFELYTSLARNNTDSLTVSKVETNDQGQLVSLDWVDSKREDLSFFGELSYRRGNFRAAINGDYVDFREGTVRGSKGAPAYWLASANAGYNLHLPSVGSVERVALNVNVSNLFNKSHLTGVAQAGRFYIGAPRTILFTLSADF